jgi:hypothetical protein
MANALDRGIVVPMTQLGVSDLLLVELVKIHCSEDTNRKHHLDAELVFDALEAIERESKIRAIQAESRQIGFLVDEIRAYAKRQEFKHVGPLISSFMKGIGGSIDDIRVRLSALRMTQEHAESMQIGRLNAAAVDAFVLVLETHVTLLETICDELETDKP